MRLIVRTTAIAAFAIFLMTAFLVKVQEPEATQHANGSKAGIPNLKPRENHALCASTIWWN
jgi:hypothetical protein